MARYGVLMMPGTPDARLLAQIVIHHLVRLPNGNVQGWVSLCASFLTVAEVAEIIEVATENWRCWKAGPLGAALKLTAEERERLRITTIAPFDMSPAERAEQRKLRKRYEREEKRRIRGAIPRAQYLAKSLSRRQPWKDMGISRATYYRLHNRP